MNTLKEKIITMKVQRLTNYLEIGEYYFDAEGKKFKIISALSGDREQDAFIAECVSHDISHCGYVDNTRIYTKNGGYGITPNFRDLVKKA